VRGGERGRGAGIRGEGGGGGGGGEQRRVDDRGNVGGGAKSWESRVGGE